MNRRFALQAIVCINVSFYMEGLSMIFCMPDKARFYVITPALWYNARWATPRMFCIAESAIRMDNSMCTNSTRCLILLIEYKIMYVFGQSGKFLMNRGYV